jgi:multidrug transporter EmrE-like cation transporter
MTIWSFLLILVSVLLSASSQLMLKAGMTSISVQQALTSMQGSMFIVRAIAGSPLVVLGFLCFGLSALVWTIVLSKIDVSVAYPFVALGIVITAFGGRLLFAEPLELLRIIGIGTIVLGVMIVAASS